jgi:hypothetical protein
MNVKGVLFEEENQWGRKMKSDRDINVIKVFYMHI